MGISSNLNLLDATNYTIVDDTAGRPSAPVEGHMIYQIDIEQVLIWNGSSWVVLHEIGTVNTWTPQVDQGATTNIAKTVVEANYFRHSGRMVTAWFQLTITGTGTAGSAASLTLPVASSGNSTNSVLGSGMIYDASVPTIDVGPWVRLSSTAIALHSENATNAWWGQTPSIALANGDSMRGLITYLVAA